MTVPSKEVTRFERAKLLHDYFKHLTTVSTGSLVFMVTFTKSVSVTAWQQVFFGVSIVSFMGCVILSMAAQTAYIWYSTSDPHPLNKAVYQVGRTGSWIAFVSGIVSLVVFALLGLGQPPAR